MKFLGRKKECGVLEQMYQRNDFQMLIHYGRRRVGKTTLQKKVLKKGQNWTVPEKYQAMFKYPDGYSGGKA